MQVASAAVPESIARHRLAPMLEARSMAVAGASAREGSFGLRLVQSVLSAGYAGKIQFINPRQSEILGKPCLPGFADLDEAPDLAVLGVGAANLEKALLDAIGRGARAAVLFDACYGDTADGTPRLQRLRDIAGEAGIPVCGGAGMGFVNVATGCVASFYGAGHLKPGGISLIAHSGSVFTTLAMNDPRFRFDLLVSPGQEIGATIDEYIDYAASRASTRAIAVFMEAARNPAGFVQSLKHARDAGVPVIVCKVGRSEESARMARSHTGALAGSQAAYAAAIAECGAISVATVDELMQVAMLCSTGRLPGAGGIGLVTDSGGLRELAMDHAADTGAPLARLSETTLAALAALLPEKLVPSNPLDCAADLTEDFPATFERGLAAMAAAPEVSMLGFEADLRDDYVYEARLREIALGLAGLTQKPCFFYSSFGQANNRGLADELADRGVPCINGIGAVLAAATKLQRWADARRETDSSTPLAADTSLADHWHSRFASGAAVDERTGLALVSAFGVPAIGSAIHDDWEDLRATAASLGYPVALKTAAAGIEHKSDRGGVTLNIAGEQALRAAYDDLTSRLGGRVIVQPMAPAGIELAFGYVRDPDFGPLVMVSAGGTLVEYFTDRQFSLAPFSEAKARALIEQLPIARLLNGVRGKPAADKEAAAKALSSFSVMCAALAGSIAEIDINPVIVSPTGAVAVDVLVVPGDLGKIA
jgi:acetyltransferase